MSHTLYPISISLPHIRLAGLSNCEQLDYNKEILIFLHGYLDNANSFATIIPSLDNKQCLAIDMAGHGLSQHRSIDAHYHLIDYAYDLAQLIEHLALKSVVVIGHSLGGIVASIYASTKPQVLRKLVLIETCGPLTEDEQSSADQITACFESRFKALAPIKQPKSLEHAIKARLMVSDLKPKHAELIMSRNVENAGKSTYLWRTDKKLRTKSGLRFTERQAMNVLCAIDCDFTVILGDKGFEKVKNNIEIRQIAFKRADIVEFPGGHHVHLESPELVAEHISHFIDEKVAS